MTSRALRAAVSIDFMKAARNIKRKLFGDVRVQALQECVKFKNTYILRLAQKKVGMPAL